MSKYSYKRRLSRQVPIGNVSIGGRMPIALQSMTNTSTNDLSASVEQCIRIAEAGGDIVRLTAQGIREAANIGEIRQELRKRGYDIPLVADVHFNPKAAFASAEAGVDKVRINPGNFVDPGRTFIKLEYNDEEYAGELRKIEGGFCAVYRHLPSPQYGYPHRCEPWKPQRPYNEPLWRHPAGMVESAMEFLRVAVRHDFFNIVISIKASNVVIMVETVRRFVAAMEAEGMDFPDSSRRHRSRRRRGWPHKERRRHWHTSFRKALAIQSACLSEAPENEIPVAKALVDYIAGFSETNGDSGFKSASDFSPKRRISETAGNIGGSNPVVVISPLEVASVPEGVTLVTGSGKNPAADILDKVSRMDNEGKNVPVVACIAYDNLPKR